MPITTLSSNTILYQHNFTINFEMYFKDILIY